MNSGSGLVIATLVLGFVAGILSGMFGIGGGLVIVPALVIVFALPLKTATGTSLFALLWPVGLLGVIEYWKNDKLDAWARRPGSRSAPLPGRRIWRQDRGVRSHPPR